LYSYGPDLPFLCSASLRPFVPFSLSFFLSRSPLVLPNLLSACGDLLFLECPLSFHLGFSAAKPQPRQSLFTSFRCFKNTPPSDPSSFVAPNEERVLLLRFPSPSLYLLRLFFDFLLSVPPFSPYFPFQSIRCSLRKAVPMCCIFHAGLSVLPTLGSSFPPSRVRGCPSYQIVLVVMLHGHGSPVGIFDGVVGRLLGF